MRVVGRTVAWRSVDEQQGAAGGHNRQPSSQQQLALRSVPSAASKWRAGAVRALLRLNSEASLCICRCD